MRGIVAAMLLGLAGCSISGPVAVIGQRGDVLTGSFTTTLSQGSFSVSNRALICTGVYPSLGQRVDFTTVCSDGRKGIGTAYRDARKVDGRGKVRMNDGEVADFLFGLSAENMTPKERPTPVIAQPSPDAPRAVLVPRSPPAAPSPPAAAATAAISAATDVFGKAWIECTQLAVGTLAGRTREAADAVALAVLQVCRPQEEQYFTQLRAEGITNPAFREGMLHRAREDLTATVVLLRLHPPQPPGPPGSLPHT